jgi:ATP-dependent RNA helicase RhlE
LSDQIRESFRTYGRHLRIATALAIGGVSMGNQVRALLNGVDVLIATPGRLLDLLQSNALRLDDVEFLVLDEADRMLDMGFVRDIRKIVAKVPAARQTMLFSATMPGPIAELAKEMLRDPVRVSVAPVAASAELIEQRLIHVDRAAKPSVLAEILRREPVERAIVFTRTKHGADKVARSLLKAGIPAEAMHGNKSQNQRTRVLSAFRAGAIRTLIATDIAARGIDVDGVSHVVNYDLPDVPESYIHRIGRTARAGAEGIAISLCAIDEMPMLRAIERLIGRSIPATDRRSSPPHASSQAHHNGKALNTHPANANGHKKPGRNKRRRKFYAPERPDQGRSSHRDRPARQGMQRGRPHPQNKSR